MSITRVLSSLISVGLIALSMGTAFASSVESMSLEIFNNDGDRHWEVSVKCVNSTETWSMTRPIDSDMWCTSSTPEHCDSNKFNLSAQHCDKVVGKSTSVPADNVAIPNPTRPSAETPEMSSKEGVSRYELMREQMQIEQQRILIQQRRLALQRKELQLKRQQLGN